MRALLIAGILGVFVAADFSKAEAAVITYSETVSGDLPFTIFPSYLGTLDVGVNTVSGQFGRAPGAPTVDTDWDPFAFSVAAGQRLDSVSFAIADATGDMSGTSWNLHAGLSVGSPIIDTFFVVSPSASNVFGAVLPLLSGDYNIYPFSFSGVGQSNYTFTLNVSAVSEVPAPASLILWSMGGGLTLLGQKLRRRRKTEQAA